jgi:hypothetical protein
MKNVVLTIAVLLLLALSSNAQAKRGIPFLFQTGDEMFEAGEWPHDALKIEPGLADYKPAFLCKHFALLWADVWSWDCHLVAGDVAQESYADLPEELSATLQSKIPFSQAKRSFWNHYGVPAMVLAFIGFGFVKRKLGGSQ